MNENPYTRLGISKKAILGVLEYYGLPLADFMQIIHEIVIDKTKEDTYLRKVICDDFEFIVNGEKNESN